jgi:hypothetical protein
VVLEATHQHEEGDLEALAVRSGLVGVPGLARSAEVEVPGLEHGGAIRDFDGARAIAAALETNVAERLFRVVRAGTRHSVDDFSVAV